MRLAPNMVLVPDDPHRTPERLPQALANILTALDDQIAGAMLGHQLLFDRLVAALRPLKEAAAILRVERIGLGSYWAPVAPDGSAPRWDLDWEPPLYVVTDPRGRIRRYLRLPLEAQVGQLTERFVAERFVAERDPDVDDEARVRVVEHLRAAAAALAARPRPTPRAARRARRAR